MWSCHDRHEQQWQCSSHPFWSPVSSCPLKTINQSIKINEIINELRWWQKRRIDLPDGRGGGDPTCGSPVSTDALTVKPRFLLALLSLGKRTAAVEVAARRRSGGAGGDGVV